MKCLVTGCAGFIGSHTVERLLAEGCTVLGIDNFDDFYSRDIKMANLQGVMERSGFRFIEGDLNDLPLGPLLRNMDSVLHLAAQPGVRASWGDTFNRYLRNNVLNTQKLLEASSSSAIRNLVYASSSSVYGSLDKLPVSENAATVPISPYGVTKVCAEHLCEAYRIQSRVPVVRLRYFSVYGPRQRPDMLVHRILRAALRDEVLDIFGNGEQTRDFTYVHDVAQANWLAVQKGVGEGVINIASGRPISVIQVVRTVERLVGRPIKIRRVSPQKGDPLHTHGSTSLAERLLGFRAMTPLETGIGEQLTWQRAQML